jgi:succinate dehydrogenase / fumarate reductase iron-sulfur subunit
MTVDETDSPAEGAEPAPRNVPKPGHLPVNELLFERQGPASPFGEDAQFPLPLDQLPYKHPEVQTPEFE